jgi:pimeloyl-ACP methyl ester carboxylesterase
MATEAATTVRRRRRFTAGGTSSRLVEAGAGGGDHRGRLPPRQPGVGGRLGPLVAAIGATGLRALAFDLPDFGETLAPAGFEHSVPGYAGFVDVALAALGVERVHLVLHDFGGPTGLAWVAGHADRLAGLTLIDIGILPGFKSSTGRQTTRARRTRSYSTRCAGASCRRW